MPKKKAKNENTHLYLALDTCVLSDMADIYKVLRTYNFDFTTPLRKIREKMLTPDVVNGKPLTKEFDPDKDMSFKKLKEYMNMMSRTCIREKIDNNDEGKEDYRFLVTPTVFSEYTNNKNPMLKECHEFVKDCCYVPKLNIRNIAEYNDKINELAVAYSRPYEHKGKTKPAPMDDDAVIDSHGQLLPSRDAKIMAEASYFGANLVTLNGRHFIYDASNARNTKEFEEAKISRRRAKGIYRINKNFGYCIKNIPIKDGKLTMGYQPFEPADIDDIFANNKHVQEGFPIKFVHDNIVERAEIYIEEM